MLTVDLGAHPAVDQLLEKKRAGRLPPPSVFVESIPAELSDLVMRMLEPAPEDRFEDLGALRAAMAAMEHLVGRTALSEPTGPVTRPISLPEPSQKNRSLTIGIVVLLLLFAGAVVVGLATFRALDERAADVTNESDEEDEGSREDDEGDRNRDNDNQPLTALTRSNYRVWIRTDDEKAVEAEGMMGEETEKMEEAEEAEVPEFTLIKKDPEEQQTSFEFELNPKTQKSPLADPPSSEPANNVSAGTKAKCSYQITNYFCYEINDFK